MVVEADLTGKQWVQTITVDSLPVNDAARIEHNGTCIAIYNLDGKFFATSGICTHEHAFLSEGYIEGQTIECPLHQGIFHIPTGKPLAPPVTVPLRTYETKISDGYVHVLMGRED